MGEFGGILKLLSTVFVILSFYYSVSIKSFLFRKVFGIEKSKANRIMKRAALSLRGEIDRNQGKVEGKPQVDNADFHHERDAKPVEKNKHKSQKNVNHQLNQALEEALNSKTDITEVAKKMNLMTFLNIACLDQRHRTLLPLVLLKSKQSIEEIKEFSGSSKSSLPLKNHEERTEFDRCFSERKNPEEQQQQEVKSTIKNQSLKETNTSEKRFNDLNRYNELKKATPRNSLDRIFHKELLCLLSVVYEHD